MAKVSHIDHIAIVVRSINQIRSFYEDALGLKISHIEEMPERGIKTAFIFIGDTKIELIEAIDPCSEVSKFLEKRGPGLHHIAFKTENIHDMEQKLKNHPCSLIYDEARPGAHKSLVNFVHPSSTGGALVEIVQ